MPTQKQGKTRRPQIVSVITSPADLRFALAMREPPDLFELRLDHLWRAPNQLESKIPRLRQPLIITARDPREGGANNLSLQKRADLLTRFLPYAQYIDVELRSARAFKELLALARKRNVRQILSFHDFKSTPPPRSLRAKAALAKASGADIFKIATRTDTPAQLARLINLLADKDADLPLSAMGMGKLGAISRLLLARCGSVLNYAFLQKAQVAGQISIDLLRSALRG